MLDIARQAVDIAELGLKNRSQENGIGEDERIFLAELRDIADSGMTRAARLLDAYENAWGENIDDVYAEMSY